MLEMCVSNSLPVADARGGGGPGFECSPARVARKGRGMVFVPWTLQPGAQKTSTELISPSVYPSLVRVLPAR